MRQRDPDHGWNFHQFSDDYRRIKAFRKLDPDALAQIDAQSFPVIHEKPQTKPETHFDKKLQTTDPLS